MSKDHLDWEVCKACVYWEKPGHDDPARGISDTCGTCLRYPQMVWREPTDWCGEFKEDK